MVAWVLYGLAGIGTLGCAGAALTFLARFRPAPPSAPASDHATRPGLSMVVPVRGADGATEEHLTALVRSVLDVPVEYLFACETRDDPAWPVCERVRAAHPDRAVTTVLTGPAEGRMGKQHNLSVAARQARHPVLGSMDADVLVRPDTLATGLRRLAGDHTGVAYFLPHYRGPGPAGGRLVALYSNYYYQLNMGALALGRPAPFITGGLWLMSPAARAALGDLGRFAGTVSDDAAIGRAVAAAGLRNEVVAATVTMPYERLGLGGGLRHVLKWLTLLRAEGLAVYLAILVAWHPVLWAVLGLGVAALTGGPVGAGVGVTLAAVLIRLAGAAALHATAYRGTSPALAGWLVPYELLAVPVLLARGLFARRITWRGRVYEIGRHGVIRTVREAERVTG